MLSLQYENLLTSSFLLYLEHQLLRKNAFFTTSGQFYKTTDTYNNLNCYSNGLGGMVSDFSISGATIATGVFINGVYSNMGQNGLISLDYQNGRVFLSGNSTATVTSAYSVKQFPVITPSFPDLSILFESRHLIRPKSSFQATGALNYNELNFPTIYLFQMGGQSFPYSFGGTKETVTNIGLFMFIDNLMNAEGICNIFKDMRHEHVPLLDSFPYNSLGGMKNNVNYNYDSLTSGRVAAGSGVWIKDVVVSNFERRMNAAVIDLPKNCYFRVAEFELSLPRLT